MPIHIRMPALSPTMEEGTLAKWLVKEGDAVAPGDVIAEIETDKATMEVESVDEGTVGRIEVAAGSQGVKVNTLIALLLEEGESADALDAPAEAAPAPRTTPVPDAPPASREEAIPARTAAELTQEPQEPSAPLTNGPGPGRIFASPLARRLAKDAQLDLASLQGSGPRGRIVRRDVEEAAARPSTMPAPSQPELAPSADAESVKAMYAEGSYEELPLDAMRATIAKRLTEAKQSIPHFYLTVDVEIDALLATRARANAALAERGIKVSVNDYVIKASALSLRDVPDCNVAFAGDRLLRFNTSDVAVAVAVEGGLFTPVIRSAERLPISEISQTMKDLAKRARDRRLAPQEYQGGSFTISNLGMFGIRNFDAVINPPHGSILALGAGEARAVVRDGAIVAANMMTATLSVDHRAIDGALGARFLKSFRTYMEDPALMAV